MSFWVSRLLVSLVAIEHVYIFVLETLLFNTPRFNKIFGFRREEMDELKNTLWYLKIKTLFANQGVYNLILAIGAFWGCVHSDPLVGIQIQFFFVLSVIVAAIFGAVTAKPTILLTQGGPAILAFLALLQGY